MKSKITLGLIGLKSNLLKELRLLFFYIYKQIIKSKKLTKLTES